MVLDCLPHWGSARIFNSVLALACHGMMPLQSISATSTILAPPVQAYPFTHTGKRSFFKTVPTEGANAGKTHGLKVATFAEDCLFVLAKAQGTTSYGGCPSCCTTCLDFSCVREVFKGSKQRKQRNAVVFGEKCLQYFCRTTSKHST